MKKRFSVALLLLIPMVLFSQDLSYKPDFNSQKDARPDAIDTIHDTYTELDKFSLHSQGLLSYGAHTNTFHIRYAFLRANLDLSRIQLFITLNAYRDTHNPDTNYSFILNNINLYDYGVNYRFTPWFNMSMSGAAVLRKNSQSLLLMPHYYHPGNPGEFDSSPAYMPRFLNAAGIRLNFQYKNWAFSYSQGDWRHSIPMAFMLKYNHQNFSIRALAQLENTDPLVYSINNYKGDYQISASLLFNLDSILSRSIIEYTFSDIMAKHWLRVEQSAEWNDWKLALRFIWRYDLRLLFESSLSYNFVDSVDLGIQAASDGRVYIISKVDF